MNCPKCKYPMEFQGQPYPPELPYWKVATLYFCPHCERKWIKVDNTKKALLDAALGEDVIPSGWYMWNSADTLPNLLKRKKELWDKFAKARLEVLDKS